jgi:malate/lactate dehydrogenase
MQHNHHYRQLLIMALLSFIAMYGLMYAMVDSFANVYNNFNQAYMAAIMAAPMVIIELIVMGSMYKNKKLNAIIMGVSALALVIFFIFIREQTAISNKQFLRSMIPHHGGALLMCEKAPIQDPEIKELCRKIIQSQQEEITQMKRMLEEK